MCSASDGIALSRGYWGAVVRPLLEDHLAGLPRAAARIGSGSDVLGLDDSMSRDHDWGLRLQLFVPCEARATTAAMLQARLPRRYAGHPTKIAFSGNSEPTLGVDVLCVNDLCRTRLGFDPRSRASVHDWLSLTGQVALELTAGEVFEDTDGDLTDLRASLAWYPEDLWRYVVATDWRRIDQELPLMQRAGDRGDDLGSRVIAARVVDITVHLAFLLARAWAPYPKWRGTLLSRLPLPPGLEQALAGGLHAHTWPARSASLATALDLLAEHQHGLGLGAAGPACVPLWDRPYLHIHPALTSALTAGITDPDVLKLPLGLGAVEQRSDNVDLLMDLAQRRACVAWSPT